MASSAKSSGACSNNTTVGTVNWTTTAGSALAGTECQSDNGVYAITAYVKNATSRYLYCVQFGFTSADIPSGATIQGFEIGYRKYRGTGTGPITNTYVYMVKGGTIGGNNIGAAGDWSTSETLDTYGSSTELAGLSWADTDVTATNFGVAMYFTAGNVAKPLPGPQNWVDQVTITVYYDAGGGTVAVRRRAGSAFIMS